MNPGTKKRHRSGGMLPPKKNGLRHHVGFQSTKNVPACFLHLDRTSPAHHSKNDVILPTKLETKKSDDTTQDTLHQATTTRNDRLPSSSIDAISHPLNQASINHKHSSNITTNSNVISAGPFTSTYVPSTSGANTSHVPTNLRSEMRRTNSDASRSSNSKNTLTMNSIHQLAPENNNNKEHMANKVDNSSPVMRKRTSLCSSSGSISSNNAPKPHQQHRQHQKLDKSNLRKGKWTAEEEEYTSRIIHHFSTGLLTLPEGTTLRSYLAKKLQCDPMRITKKFAGASCLGKRVYHLCERTQATLGDIEAAKAELARLEHRFRFRVEHGQSASVLSPLTPGPASTFPYNYTANQNNNVLGATALGNFGNATFPLSTTQSIPTDVSKGNQLAGFTMQLQRQQQAAVSNGSFVHQQSATQLPMNQGAPQNIGMARLSHQPPQLSSGHQQYHQQQQFISAQAQGAAFAAAVAAAAQVGGAAGSMEANTNAAAQWLGNFLAALQVQATLSTATTAVPASSSPLPSVQQFSNPNPSYPTHNPQLNAITSLMTQNLQRNNSASPITPNTVASAALGALFSHLPAAQQAQPLPQYCNPASNGTTAGNYANNENLLRNNNCKNIPQQPDPAVSNVAPSTSPTSSINPATTLASLSSWAQQAQTSANVVSAAALSNTKPSTVSSFTTPVPALNQSNTIKATKVEPPMMNHQPHMLFVGQGQQHHQQQHHQTQAYQAQRQQPRHQSYVQPKPLPLAKKNDPSSIGSTPKQWKAASGSCVPKFSIEHSRQQQALRKQQSAAAIAAMATQMAKTDNNNFSSNKTSPTGVGNTTSGNSYPTITNHNNSVKPASPPSTSSPIQVTAGTIPSPQRSKEEQDAGTTLLGFISKLREGHAAALEKVKREEEEAASKKRSALNVQTQEEQGYNIQISPSAVPDNNELCAALKATKNMPYRPSAEVTVTRNETNGARINGLPRTSYSGSHRNVLQHTSNGGDSSHYISRAEPTSSPRGIINYQGNSILSCENQRGPQEQVRSLAPSILANQEPLESFTGDSETGSSSSNNLNNNGSEWAKTDTSGATSHPCDSESITTSSEINPKISANGWSCENGKGVTDSSGSSEDDSEDTTNSSEENVNNKGGQPLPKRRKKNVGKLSSRNVADHTTRMDALEKVHKQQSSLHIMARTSLDDLKRNMNMPK
eukprot:CAMPEP_0194428892 /NCGR_PEP_ID=MMETSP0176-20130528/43560_1 /TAXON_ID=216777 /ORGANISM="Proboscia alata, Strain PI-D3" /LENGTH=1181 /DNA_ID=CAMNT_0039241565 /DNA_START=243 /DNA_END=3788 /DNA_ORIENTATION=-